MAEETPPPPPGFELDTAPTAPSLDVSQEDNALTPAPEGFDHDTPPNRPGFASGEAWDYFMKSTPLNRMAVASAQGFKEGQENGKGVAKAITDALGELHVTPNYETGEGTRNPIKQFNQSILAPAAAGVEALFRGVSGVIEAGVRGGGQALEEVGVSHTPSETAQNEARGFIDWFMIQSAMSDGGFPRASSAELESVKRGAPVEGAVGADATALVSPEAPKAPAMAAKIKQPESHSVLPTENPLVDKAGNLNLKYINTSEDVKNVLRQTAEDNGQFTEQRGYVSNAQTTDEATHILEIQKQGAHDVANGIPDFIANLRDGQTFTKEQATASRMWISQAGADVKRLSDIAAKTKTPEDLQSFAEAEQRLALVMGIDNASVAETARTLQARQIVVGDEAGASAAKVSEELTKRGIEDPAKRAEIMSSLETPQQIAKWLQDERKPNFGDMALEYVINNYLSGPFTHLTYAGFRFVYNVFQSVETGLAGVVGKGRSLLTKEVLSAEDVGALNREHAGITDTLAKEQLPAAKAEELRNRQVEIKEQIAAGGRVYTRESLARLTGYWGSTPDGLAALAKSIWKNETIALPGEDAASLQSFSRNSIPGSLGKIINIPTRAIGGIHSMQRVMGYAENLNALSWRQALSEGFDGDALAARVAQLKLDPPAEIMEAARDGAKYSALMGEPGKLGRNIERLANTNHYTKALAPFARVANHITEQGFMERTPLGLLSTDVRETLSGAKGGAAQDEAIARMLVGSSVATGMVFLAAQGKLTGAPPTDRHEADFNNMIGKPANSILLGDTWVPYYRWGPIGKIMSTGADFHEAAQVAHQDGLTAAAGQFAVAIGKDIMGESVLRGIAEFTRAIQDDRYRQTYFNNTVAGALTPFSVGMGQIAREQDPYQRVAKTLSEAVQRKIPGAQGSQALEPKIDIFGNPVASFAKFQSPVSDPVYQALDIVKVYPGPVADRIGGVKLTETQKTMYAIRSGRMSYLMLQPQVTSASWMELTPFQQATQIKATIEQARAMARSSMLMDYPDITRQGFEQKKALIEGLGTVKK